LTKLTTSKGAGMADSIWKFSNQPIAFESKRIGRRIRISKLRRSLNKAVPGTQVHQILSLHHDAVLKRANPLPSTSRIDVFYSVQTFLHNNGLKLAYKYYITVTNLILTLFTQIPRLLLCRINRVCHWIHITFVGHLDNHKVIKYSFFV